MRINHRKLKQMVDRIPRGIERKEADLEVQIKAIKTEILAAIGTDQQKLAEMQKQLDALDVKLAEKHSAPFQGKSLETVLKESDTVSRILRDRKGSAVITIPAALLERKAIITSATTGVATTGVLQIDRVPGITAEARQVLTVRQLLTARPTAMQVVDFVRVKTPLSMASPIAEASEKFQNQLIFESKSEKVRLLATWIPATRQILDDFSELLGFIQSSLPYYVNLAEEIQLLSGDSNGENLDGLITQASPFSTALLSAPKGWTKLDIIGRVINQITAAKEIQPTFVVMHPTDWWDIRLTKDSFGRYLMGSPQSDVAPSLFNLSVSPTTSITQGTFLVGSGAPEAAEIRDRAEMIVEISTEHSDYFTKNLVAVRAEKRVALIVKRPGSYITGTFTTSP